MVKLVYSKYLQVFISIAVILALYVSCPSSNGASTDLSPPVVSHGVAVTDVGRSVTLTVTATDPSGVFSYTTPYLNLDGGRVSLLRDEVAESIWVYTLVSLDDVGKKVTYTNVSAIDTEDNESALFSNLETGVLAGLDHKMTVFGSDGKKKTNQAIANEGDTIKLSIIAAPFEGITYAYEGIIKIDGNPVIASADPLAPNEFTYTITATDEGLITYTAKVTPPARGPIVIVTDYSSLIVVPDKNPEFTAALVASGAPAQTGDTLTLTVTATDAGGLASATARVRVGDRWTFPTKTIEVLSENGEKVVTHEFLFTNIVEASNNGDVYYSIIITDIDGNTTSTDPEYTKSNIIIDSAALLTTHMVGLSGEVEKTALKEGDTIRLTANLEFSQDSSWNSREGDIGGLSPKVAEDSTTPAIIYNPSLKIGGEERTLVKIDSEGLAVFEYVVGVSDSGEVTYSVEPTVDNVNAGQNLIDQAPGITVDTIAPIVSAVVLRKNPANAYGTYAKVGDVIQLEIDSGTDTGTALTYEVTMTVGTSLVRPVQQIEQNKFNYTVLENQNGAVTYTVRITDRAGNTATKTNSATGYVVDTILPTINYRISMQRGLNTYQNPLPDKPPMRLNLDDELRVSGTVTDSNATLDINVQVKIGTETVDAIENLDGGFRYRVQENDNGIVSYSVTATDVAGNIASERITANFLRYLYIANREQLIAFANDVNAGNAFAGKVVILSHNIDLAGSTFAGIGSHPDNPFSGTFDGNKKTISNLDLWTDTTDAIGFFGTISGATITDLTIAKGKVTGKQNVGGVVGNALNSTITGVRTGSLLAVKADNNTTNNYWNSVSNIGGILGQSTNTTIENVYNEASVTGRSFIGGIVGLAEKVTLRYVYNTGTVKSLEGRQKVYIGGIIGYIKESVESGSISHVYNTGRITALQEESLLGGIVGYVMNNSSTFSNMLSGSGSYARHLNYPGQVFGEVHASDAIHTATGRRIYARGDIRTRGIGKNSSSNRPYTPNTMTLNVTDTPSANTLVTNVFEGNAKWNGNVESYPTLRYFEGWN